MQNLSTLSIKQRIQISINPPSKDKLFKGNELKNNLQCIKHRSYINNHIEKELSKFFNEIFNFGTASTTNNKDIQELGNLLINPTAIKNTQSESQLARHEILDLIDNKLEVSMQDFAKKIECISKISRLSANKEDYSLNIDKIDQKSKNNNEKLVKDIETKLQFCCKKITELINYINLRRPWCLCGRNKCPIQYDQQHTLIMMKKFAQTKTNLKFTPSDNLLKNEPLLYKFFNIKNDNQCDILSLKAIQDGRNKIVNCNTQPKIIKSDQVQNFQSQLASQTIKFIKNTYINKNIRIQCPFFGEKQSQHLINKCFKQPKAEEQKQEG